MSKLLKFMGKKRQFKSKKLLSCFNSSPCGSGKNINNVVVNKLANPDKIRENASFSFYQKIPQNKGWSHSGATLI